jgi:ABC-type transporter Mla subunit MlaD
LVFDGGGGKREKRPAMKLKDLFLGLCIAALLVSEMCLFVANQQKRDAISKMNAAIHDADQARAELAQLKQASDQQAMSDMRLSAENKSLSRKLSDLQNQNASLNNASQQLSQQLTSAQLAAQQAAEQQQEQIQQAQYDAAQSQATTARTACMNNLREIDAAKNEWALENGKGPGSVPAAQDLLPFLTGGIFPVCPSDGTYTIGAIGIPPSCSVHGPLVTQ